MKHKYRAVVDGGKLADIFDTRAEARAAGEQWVRDFYGVSSGHVVQTARIIPMHKALNTKDVGWAIERGLREMLDSGVLLGLKMSQRETLARTVLDWLEANELFEFYPLTKYKTHKGVTDV